MAELPREFDYLQGTVILFARDGTPIDCNPATEKLVGYDRGRLDSVSLTDLVDPRGNMTHSGLRDRIAEAADGEATSFEWRIQRANGEPRWVEVAVDAIALDDGQYVLAEFRDLTAYKAQGLRLQLLYRVLRHNLRNDMSVIQGYAEHLEAAIEANDLERQIEIIRKTASSVGELSESVGNLERLVEKDATERTRESIADVVRTVVSDVRPEYPESVIEVDTAETTFVSVDRGFYLALEHAITNAVEHNDSNTPTVTIRTEATEQEVLLRITDNGPGIPDIEIDALHGETTQVEHGEGLGLSIIKWCTQSLGGEVKVETIPEEGSTLTIRLPRVR